jgi:MFS family permease
VTSSFTTTPPRDLTVRLASAQSVVAVALLFAVNGLIIGGFGGVLPSIRGRLDINATHIAIMLLTAGLAGIVAMQVGGRLSDAIGARQVALAGLPLLIVAATTFAFATTFPAAVMGAVLLGLGNGTMDVAMNAVGVQVESARQRPIMSSFHALWSVGGFVGAGSVLLMATLLNLTGAAIVMPLMLFLTALAVVAFVVAYKITPPTAVVQHSVDGATMPKNDADLSTAQSCLALDSVTRPCEVSGWAAQTRSSTPSGRGVSGSASMPMAQIRRSCATAAAV